MLKLLRVLMLKIASGTRFYHKGMRDMSGAFNNDGRGISP